MREAGLLLASFALSWLGFALLASSQTKYRHAMALTRAPSPPVLRLRRGVGALLLLAALVLTGLSNGPSFGTVLWLLMLSLAALTVALVLAWRPRWLTAIAQMGARVKPRQPPS